MNTAIVIPTLNAVKRGLWRQVLDSVAVQTLHPDRKIVIDSASCDETCPLAESYGWECHVIDRKDFNHGGTRDSAVRKLAEEGIETVIFLSQDVIPAAPDSLQNLYDFLWNNPIAGCFGKQQTKEEHSLNAWQRKQCYPPETGIRTLKDVPEYGMMAVFFSNAFSAWKTADVIRFGGFPETDFGEDMLLAAKVLNQGGSTGYCAEAAVFHEHSNTLRSLFLRGMQIGSFHRRNPELLKQFGKGKISLTASIPCSIWLPLGIKFMGYLCGRTGKRKKE